jgi:putative ABC transport system permease protein
MLTRVLLSRILALFAVRRSEARLADEIQTHLDLLTEEHVGRGMSLEDARAAARRSFGAVETVKEIYRDRHGLPFVQTLAQDVRFGARLLVKDRWFTLTAAVTLAVGIAATSTVFAIIDAVLFRGLPEEAGDRIVHVGTRSRMSDPVRDAQSVSYLDYQDLRDSARTFSGIGAFTDATMNVSDDRRAAERFRGSYVSANAFQLLGRQPVAGRDFLPDDDRPGAARVAILGHRIWTDRYGGDPAVVGQVVRINAVPTLVVGIMPAGFRFPYMTDVWQPLAMAPDLERQARDVRRLDAFGRLSDHVSIDQARSDLEAVAARLAREYPDTNANIQPTVRPYIERYIGWQVGLLLSALMGAVVFVLLIACVNVANLLLARSSDRAREIAIRSSLGATRWRIVRQLLVESVLLALIAGAVAFGLANAGVQGFSGLAEQIGKPYWMEFVIDGRVFMFLSTLCLGTSLVFGLVPAIHASNTNAREALKEGGRTGNGGIRARRWSSVLVIAELALTVVLVSSAVFYIRSFLAVYRADLVLDTSQLLTMRLTLPDAAYATPVQRTDFYRQLEERLMSMPAIASVAIASTAPWSGAAVRELTIDGRTPAPGTRPPIVSTVTIGPRYFETLGLQLLRGRALDPSGESPGSESAIVNQEFVRRHFAGEDPIGHRIGLTTPNSPESTTWTRIVGISPTVRQRTDGPGPVVYLPDRGEHMPLAALIVRGKSGLNGIAALVRDEVRMRDANLPLFDVKPMDRLLAESRWPQRVFGALFAVFATIGLMLSLVGLYAVTAHSVTERTREIGVRMALGASSRDVRWLILRRTATHLAFGLLLGLGGALGVGRFLRGVLQPGAFQPIALLPVAVALILVGLAACFSPARRATHLDPLAALRSE